MFKNKIVIHGYIMLSDDEKIELYGDFDGTYYSDYIWDIAGLLESKISEFQESKFHDNSDESDFDYYGGVSIYLDKACVSFYISDKRMILEEVQEKYTKQLFGALDVYGENFGYSEWTIMGLDLKNFTIGNHDLIKILSQYEGKYLNFILEY